ncbi:MAG: PAS domain-containing protein [Spirochaeta sp.]|nr:PAS domain-containing protein [Spirochaeta sp.]
MKAHFPSQPSHNAFDRSPALLAILDAEFTFINVNRAYAEQAGSSVDDLIGRNYFDLFPDENAEAVFRQVRDTRQPYSAVGQPVDDPRNREMGGTYWDWHLVPIEGASATPGTGHLALTIHDVTEEMLLKRELQYNYETLRSVFEHTSVAVVRTDTNFHLLFANQAYFTLLGSAAGDRVGEVCGSPGELPREFCSAWRQRLRQVAETGDSVTFDFDLPSRTGSDHTYQADVNPEYNPEGTVRSVITFINDITTMKEREEELENLLIEMNHRIKNNLATIEALARVELDVGDKSKAAAIDDIISRINAIGQVHQTLYETRSFSEVAIGPYIRELLDSLLAGAATGPGTYVPRVRAEDLNVSSKVATKLGLMLAELTTNTIKYAACPAGCEISVDVTVADERVTVRYHDGGRGLDPSVRSIADLAAGTGVMILHALAGDLGGTIELDTAELDTAAKPAVFVIRFPTGTQAM